MKHPDANFTLINHAKYYRITFWTLQIFNAIISGSCIIASIVFLCLNKNTFPLKFIYFGYTFGIAMGIQLINLLLTSFLLRFVFKSDINELQSGITKETLDAVEKTSELNETKKTTKNTSSGKAKNALCNLTSDKIVFVIFLISLALIVGLIVLLGLVLS